MTDLASLLPDDWRSALEPILQTGSFRGLGSFLEKEYAEQTVFPPIDDLFSAFRLTPLEKVRVVILGQDPYHDDGQAHGLAFSVRPGIPFPPSLRNIFRELHDDIGCAVPASGSLIPWAKQGVLLLNTVLTVRAHHAASHQKHGWEQFTDGVISLLSGREKSLVFVLWGAPAQKKKALIDMTRHTVIESAHPSPLSAYRGFFGSRPFSQIDRIFLQKGGSPIDWKLE